MALYSLCKNKSAETLESYVITDITHILWAMGSNRALCTKILN